MYAYQTILTALEEQVLTSYPRQVLDQTRPDYGAFLDKRDAYPNADHGANARYIANAAYLFFAAESVYGGDEALFERLQLAIAFQRRWQRPTGLIDLISVNWESPPDTGFTVQLLSPVVALARRRAAENSQDQRAQSIADDLGDYIRTAALGMIDRGFHTPNHRWVVCSALAQAMSLFPDLPAMEYLERILAETIDINEDGEYTERSTGIYNAVCNRSLRFMADHLDKPALLDPVRQNLDMMTHLFHHDGTVVTSISNRQDRGLRVVPVSLADSFFDMAQRDGNGIWARAADLLMAKGADERHFSWLIHPFMVWPEYCQDQVKRAPLPDNFRKVFPVSKLWRVKQDILSATAAGDNTTSFALRYGDINLKAIKVAGTYLTTAMFMGDLMEAVEDGVRLIHQGERRKLPGYDLPLDKPVPLGQFYEMRPERERWTLPPLDQFLTIREVENGFDLHLKTEGGLDRITFQIECCFEGPGYWETDDQVIQVDQGQTTILKSGYGVFHRDEHGLRLGPGQIAHRMWQMRGTELEPDSFRVLITLQTPVDYVFEIRYGLWSPATGDLVS